MEETDEAIERTESELAKLKAENSELAQQFNKFASQMQTYRQRFDILSDMEKNMAVVVRVVCGSGFVICRTIWTSLPAHRV